MYRLNKMGDNTMPCGTPFVYRSVMEAVLSLS